MYCEANNFCDSVLKKEKKEELSNSECIAGPGCSSLGVGAMVEIGPFGVKSDGKSLYARQFPWNKGSSILDLLFLC